MQDATDAPQATPPQASPEAGPDAPTEAAPQAAAPPAAQADATPAEAFAIDEVDKLALHTINLERQLSTVRLTAAIDAVKAETARHEQDAAMLGAHEHMVVARIAAKRGVSVGQLTKGWVYNFDTGRWEPRDHGAK